MNKKISIIIPVYNSEKYIEKCVRSIINQTYKNIEVIIVDDGSKDNSISICNNIKNEYKHMDIKIIKKENGGVSSARNKGIEVSSGDYIIFVDSDDYIELNMCELLINMVDDKKNNLPICGINLVDLCGNTIRCVNLKRLNNAKINYLKKEEYLVLFINDMLNSCFNKLFESKILKQFNIRFNENISLAEDFNFVVNYIKYIDEFSIINECLYNYVQLGKGTLSVKAYKNMYEIQIDIYDKLISISNKYNIDKENLKYIKEAYYIIIWRSIRNLIRNDESIKYKFKIKETIKILTGNKIIELEDSSKSIKFMNINSIGWYIKNKFLKK